MSAAPSPRISTSISRSCWPASTSTPTGASSVTGGPADPRFSEPLSGLYWQIADDRGQTLRSRSLWDSSLLLPKDEPAAGEVHRHEAIGPANGRVLIAERRVRLDINGRETPVTVAVAIDAAHVAAATTAFATDLATALGLLGIVLAAATAIQVGLGLRPLDVLRRGVAEYPRRPRAAARSRRARRSPAAGR